MKEIFGYIIIYWKEVDKRLLIACTLLTAFLIYLNYGFGLEQQLTSWTALPWPSFTGHVILFAAAFIIPHTLFRLTGNRPDEKKLPYLACIFAAPMIFALKMGMDTDITFNNSLAWNDYWNQVLHWPIRLAIIMFILFILWKTFHRDERFYGMSSSGMGYKPYIIMLLIMIPLIALASTQPDFLHTYPKLHNIQPLPADADPAWWYKLLFELSYGSDFLSIELFFRGFLVIGFARWAGKDAIIPMACFYCTIHFGKPLGECISSYFGGLLLGIVSYQTRSIYGGLMVHLGIAWLMEAGGYIGNTLKG